MNIKDKKVLITGASRGLGKEIALCLKSNGAYIIGISKNKDDLIEICNDGFSCDLSDLLQTKKILNEITEKHHNIDVLINNAGIGVYNNFIDLQEKDWFDSLNVNLNSVFVITQKVVKNMKKNNSGLIVNIGSGAGVIPMASRVSYCTTKFALRGFSLSLFEEYKDTNINVGLMTLGSILTDFGNLTVKQKKLKQKTGEHSYFSPDFVAENIKELIEDDYFIDQPEFVLYPPSYEK